MKDAVQIGKLFFERYLVFFKNPNCQTLKNEELLTRFDPNGVGLKNGKFIGLPFDEKDADIVLMSVPWDVTVSYAGGTSRGPGNILEASSQLDLFLPDAPETWKQGIYFMPPDQGLMKDNDCLRTKAEQYISALENGVDVLADDRLFFILQEINLACEKMVGRVYRQAKQLISQGKKTGLVGGDHSTPLGLIQALSEVHEDMGILQIDAHCDLRKAYEGFVYSHASIFYNVLDRTNVKKIVQTGIRDLCDAEFQMASEDERISLFLDNDIQRGVLDGIPFREIADEIVNQLPTSVYVSFDIDGLEPQLCPGTGTPVPGGLRYEQAIYLLRRIKESGREVVGFDLCEVGGKSEWDGNVGARMLYYLCSLL